MNKKKRSLGRQVAIQETTHALCTGICVNCIHQKTCTFPKMENRLFCEEYEV